MHANISQVTPSRIDVLCVHVGKFFQSEHSKTGEQGKHILFDTCSAVLVC